MESQSSLPGAIGVGDGRFLDHLSSAADMVAARRFREGEVEILRALSITPSDVRALKLLALVRFKLGRLEEARAVCRELVAILPRDAGIRLKLGLIALKMDRLDESVNELEVSARLAPDDLRAWSYLGFAYARRGEPAEAAAAFRRAGQESRAVQLEGEAPGGGMAARPAGSDPAPPAGQTRVENLDAGGPTPGHGADRGIWSSADVGAGIGGAAPDSIPSDGFEPAFDVSSPMDAREPRTDPDRFLTNSPSGAGAIPVSPLIGYAVSRLAPAAEQPAWVGATARLAIGDEVFVRNDAAVACSGTARWEAAHRRVHGRATEERLGGDATGDRAFCRVTGRGVVFVAAPAGRLVPLRLEDDILYIREDRVLAFEGTVSWEYGHIPGADVDVRVLQFRGSGLVAIRIDGEPGAVKVTPEQSLFVSSPHLLGWIGRVAPSGMGTRLPTTSGAEDSGFVAPAPFGLMCEGEGVVLVDVRGAPASEGSRKGPPPDPVSHHPTKAPKAPKARHQ